MKRLMKLYMRTKLVLSSLMNKKSVFNCSFIFNTDATFVYQGSLQSFCMNEMLRSSKIKISGDGFDREYIKRLAKTCNPDKNETCSICEQVYLTLR